VRNHDCENCNTRWIYAIRSYDEYTAASYNNNNVWRSASYRIKLRGVCLAAYLSVCLFVACRTEVGQCAHRKNVADTLSQPRECGLLGNLTHICSRTTAENLLPERSMSTSWSRCVSCKKIKIYVKWDLIIRATLEYTRTMWFNLYKLYFHKNIFQCYSVVSLRCQSTRIWYTACRRTDTVYTSCNFDPVVQSIKNWMLDVKFLR